MQFSGHVRTKLHLKGKPDIWVKNKLVVEIKNPYDAFSFNKKRAELEMLYYWQCQAYCWLCDVPVCYIVYTLNENYYMVGDDKNYDHLGLVDKMIVKKIEHDQNAINQFTDRLPYILDYIKKSQELIVSDIENTETMLTELKGQFSA